MPDMTLPDIGTLVGLCVPSMGMHSLPGADIRDTTLFHQTMIVGYYHGRRYSSSR